MLVGDPQQSIYGFREADFELFVSRSRSLPCLRLSRNYRSKESLQRYVDALFGSLWGEDFQPSAPPAARDEEADPFAEAPGKFSGVEYWPADRFDTESVAERISQLIEEGHAPGEIALLFRKGKTMSAYQDALARRNIESQIEGGSARFYTRLEVRDVANMLRAVTDPTDRFALLALLRSPFVDLSLNTMVKAARHEDALELLQDYGQLEEADREKAEDFLEWFLPLREYGDRLPAWELMSEALAASNFWPNLARRPNARQAIANVRKLLSLATENPELGGQPFAEQVRDIQSVKHKEGEAPLFDERANAVTLTTIHKAKGLEFPVVVLPDTYGLLEGNLQADVFADRKLGIVATKFGLRASLYYAWLKEKQRVKNHQEELRVLYVALTRAVSRLCIVTVRSGQNEKNIAGLLPKRVPADERNGILVREPQAQEVNSD
jgi:ATP-dependent exoDNAse (exonuclease V) beta subunit